jgi:hypothetical protein
MITEANNWMNIADNINTEILTENQVLDILKKIIDI